MKIISKRRAMAIYRRHPESRLFRLCTGKYPWSGSVCHWYDRDVQDISAYWPCTLNDAGTATARTPA